MTNRPFAIGDFVQLEDGDVQSERCGVIMSVTGMTAQVLLLTGGMVDTELDNLFAPTSKPFIGAIRHALFESMNRQRSMHDTWNDPSIPA